MTSEPLKYLNDYSSSDQPLIEVGVVSIVSTGTVFSPCVEN